jgi:multiple sugar transport system permease protein/raffinose/stachyose/melibiose transport system permease protein
MTHRRQLLLYLLPGGLLVTVFFLVPLLAVVALSTTNWVGIGLPTPVGLSNFVALAGDSTFVKALFNTFAWVLVGTFIQTPLCLVLALVMMRKIRAKGLIRTVLVLPNIISAAALALLWYFVFHVDLGVVNATLSAVGLEDLRRAWLSDPTTALWTTIIPFTLYVGIGMVLFLNQISTIPAEYYEAAEMDGASGLQRDRYITLPLLKRAIALWILFDVSYALRTFEYPFLMTGGGPADASTSLSLYIYNEMIVAFRYGLSMAAGVVTLAVGVVFMLGVVMILRRTESAT